MNDYYLESGQIEGFLRGLLNAKLGCKTSRDLKGAFQAIKLNEEGKGFMTHSEYESRVRSMSGYFRKALDIIIERKKYPKSKTEELRIDIKNTKCSDDIWRLYLKLNRLRNI